MKNSAFAFVLMLGVSLSLTLGASNASATIIYGDFNDFSGGGVVEYTDVTESSFTDPVPPARFNAPTANVNQLSFITSNFGADPSSTGSSAPFDITDIQIAGGFEVASGSGITEFTIDEGGALTLLGVGTEQTFVEYGVFGFINITEVDGVGITPINVPFSSSVQEDLASAPGSRLWELSVEIDIAGVLASNGFGDFELGATAGTFVIDDRLIAFGEQNAAGALTTLAAIDKKTFSLNATLNQQIPEPSAGLLALLAGLACVARRR